MGKTHGNFFPPKGVPEKQKGDGSGVTITQTIPKKSENDPPKKGEAERNGKLGRQRNRLKNNKTPRTDGA